jgi:hypothetical protein
MLTNNPKIVTTNLAACWDPKQASTVPSVSVIADKIADLSSKAYTTYASGGITYYVWTYTSTGSFNTGDYPLDLDVLLVAGGGGGGAYASGPGGGAGGVRALSKQTVPAGIHTITVGAGGAGGVWSSPLAEKGNDTIWNSTSNYAFSAPAFLANGGGEGGRGWLASTGGDGGCGGGGGSAGSCSSYPGCGGAGGSGNEGSYDPVEGYAGGAGLCPQYNDGAGGGGGGAAAVGTNSVTSGATAIAGSGGAGLANDWRTGSTQYYGGGGGGASYQGTDGTGGTGGGGNGGDVSTKTPGTANTGGGGGGSDDYIGTGTPPANSGAPGGSGIVVIRLADVSGSINRSFLSDQAMNGGTAQMYTGTCFDFDGTDDLVLTSDPVITGTGDFTLTAWINRATVNGTDFICGNYGTGNTGIEYYGASNGGVRCYIGGSNVISATTMVADTWYHVVVTRTSGTGQIYINGVADGAAVSISASIASGLNFAIGNGPNYTSENFDGIIADVKAFDIALSAANIKELYDDSAVIIPTKNAAAGGFVSQANLKGWWTLAEGAGDICYDGSGNGYHGIVSNEDGDEWLTGQTGCPQLVTGYNRPMLFNGSSDYVDCGTDSSLRITGDITVAAWVYWAPGSTGENVIYCDGAYCETCGTLLQTRSATTLRFMHNTGSVYYFFDAGTGWDAGSWHHVAMTYSTASTTMTGYIDGASFATDSSGTAATGSRTNATTIGKASWTAGRYWPGIINEVIVYNTPLALADIQALAATGPNGGPLPPDPTTMTYSTTSYSSSNLKGYWRNDGNPSLASTATWTDRSGNGNNGTAYGSPYDLLFKQGYNGSESTNSGRDNQGFPLKQKDVGAMGIHLHGVPAAGSVTDPGNTTNPMMAPPGQTVISSGEVNAGDTFTVSAWINPTSLGTGQNRTIVRKQTQNSSWPAYGIMVGSAGTLVADYSTTNYGQCLETYTTATGLIEQDKWYHVVFVKPAGAPSVNYLEVKLYINGVDTAWTNSLYGNHLYSNTVATSTQPTYTGRFLDGSDLTGTWRNPFIGQIGPVHLYSRGLTPEEVTQNFNAQRSRFGI